MLQSFNGAFFDNAGVKRPIGDDCTSLYAGLVAGLDFPVIRGTASETAFFPLERFIESADRKSLFEFAFEYYVQ